MFWRNDNKFYKAIVTAFRPSDWSHRLQYPFDGEHEWNQLFRPMVFVAPGDGEVGEGMEEVAALEDDPIGDGGVGPARDPDTCALPHGPR